MNPLSNSARTDEAAAFIANELRTLLDRYKYDSHMSRRIAEACPAHRHGLTNLERLLATVIALAAVQADIARDLGDLKFESAADWDEDDDEAA